MPGFANLCATLAELCVIAVVSQSSAKKPRRLAKIFISNSFLITCLITIIAGLLKHLPIPEIQI